MYYSKIVLFFILSFKFSYTQQRSIKKLKESDKITDYIINEEQKFQLDLKKNIYYHINVLQKGIDVELTLKDNKNTKVAYKDSPNGKEGLETFLFSPDKEQTFTLIVRYLKEEGNPKTGKIAIEFKRITNQLKTFSYNKLIEDFSILKNAYLETKVGLWYANYNQFDSICNLQKNKITDQMNSLEFYKIIAPITAFTNEGHSAIRHSLEVNNHRKQFGKHLPFLVKIIGDNVYIINNKKTNGYKIKSINNHKINTILKKFYSIEPSDGYNKTSKRHWIENAFFKYYYLFFEQHPKNFKLELINHNNKKEVHNFQPISYKELVKNYNNTHKRIPHWKFKNPIAININKKENYALLTVNSFWKKLYKDKKVDFKNFVQKSFDSISKLGIKNLIIDVRKNEGGEQGMEDILLSHLITKSYKKYDYVEVPSYSYSFLPYTRYNLQEEVAILKKRTLHKFSQNKDGRYLNKSTFFNGLPPAKTTFTGNLYILIGGLSFSGGSEFAALAKNHTNAIFIGEETGGGYYGNTSGTYLNFTLPNTNITGRVPLEKFILNCKKTTIPFGRGLIPDYNVQLTIQDFLQNKDTELDFIKKLINKQ